MAGPRFDLQSHSTRSDGALAPAEVVARAAQAGIELLALTDHDTVDGVGTALGSADAEGITVVPGVEISALAGDEGDFHICGYAIDHRDRVLRERLALSRDDRDLRAQRMAARLRELGWELDETEMDARRRAGLPIGRPHLADAAVAHPANAARLAEEEVGERSAFLVAYLINGAPAFLSREVPTQEEAIRWIHDAGGVAVWAHPFFDLAREEEVLAAFLPLLQAGIDGIECLYATHTAEQTRYAAGLCHEHDLLITGSADFHGPRHREFSAFGAFELHGVAPRLGPIDVRPDRSRPLW